jgi:hypothetical protein
MIWHDRRRYGSLISPKRKVFMQGSRGQCNSPIMAFFCISLIASVSACAPATPRSGARLTSLETLHGVPTGESIVRVYDEFDYTSAVNAYAWAMPAVNQAGYIHTWRDVFEAEWGQYVALATAQDRRGNLTPTTSSTYALAVADLSETGPLVIEDLPGNNVGIVTDLWHRLLGEVGFAGPFEGKGGKILILGPGQEEPAGASEAQYHFFRSTTNQIFFGTRLLDADKEKALREQGPLLAAYPYSQRSDPPRWPLIFANEREWSQNPPSGLAYFERLARALRNEPVAERDRFMMAQLKTLGIEVGKPFEPNARQKRILTEAALAGELLIRTATAYRRGTPPYWEGKHWRRLFVIPASQRAEHYDHFEERAILYWEIFGIGITSTKPGTGSAYAVTHEDSNGALLDGGKRYRLRIPADIPVAMFWSVCAYDEPNRTFIEGTKNVMIGSQEPGYTTNPDGTIDVYFGPTAPAGKETNWIQTKPDRVWFSYFRFFGPNEPFFDKTWVLPDFEPLD